MATETTKQALAARLVQNEVIHCVSSLVSHLMLTALEPGSPINDDDYSALTQRQPDADDYREAAEYSDDDNVRSLKVEALATGRFVWGYVGATADSEPFDTEVAAWIDAFGSIGADTPDGSEVYEHWIVSDFLADALAAKGESVAKDVCGLTIWGRATTGQSISMDHVIQQIAVETYGVEA